MKKLLLIIPAILLLATACNQKASVKQNTQTSNPPTQTTQTPPQNQVESLPSDVLPEQINTTYSVNGNLYALAFENNVNYHFSELEGKAIKWHGVLRSQDNGKSWIKFFSITDPDNPDYKGYKLSYNPVGIFSENKKIYVDIANTNGAGSGEGELIRFLSNDGGKTWQQMECYYFIPEKYYLDYNDFSNGKANTDKISPNSLNQIKGCIY